jgi:hypothetical protein
MNENVLPKGEKLDVQWSAHVVKDGKPTPAAGDSTTNKPDWIAVEDPNWGDEEPVNKLDGTLKED